MRYRYDPDQGRMVDEHGRPMVGNSEAARDLQCPAVAGAFEGFASPVDGRPIDDRRAWREDLRRNNAVPAQDLRPYDSQRKLKNRRFIERRRLWDHAHEGVERT